MKVFTEAISIAIFSQLIISCSDSGVPVECIRFSSSELVTLSELAEVIIEHNSGFEQKSYANSFTERQNAAGKQWIVLRSPELELSLRTHEGTLSDVCAYKHDDRENIETARTAIRIVKAHLDNLKVPYKTL